jgi:hypothetical protein
MNHIKTNIISIKITFDGKIIILLVKSMHIRNFWI